MAAPAVKVEGDRRLHAELARAADRLGDLSDVNARAASMVASAAAPRAPRNSGRLAASVRPGAASAAVGIVQASAPYAGAIHWGWRARGISAQPWLVETAAQTEPAWVNLYWTEIDRTLDAIAGGP